MSQIESLFGRLLVLFIYCSVIFSSSILSAQYKSQFAKKIAIQFIDEVYESGADYSQFCNLFEIEAKLGYKIEFSIVGKDRALSHKEILSSLEAKRFFPEKNDFFTCKLISKHDIIRVGGY